MLCLRRKEVRWRTAARRTVVVAWAAAELQQQPQVAQHQAGGWWWVGRRQRPDRAAAEAAYAGEAAGGPRRGDRHMVRNNLRGAHRRAVWPVLKPERSRTPQNFCSADVSLHALARWTTSPKLPTALGSFHARSERVQKSMHAHQWPISSVAGEPRSELEPRGWSKWSSYTGGASPENRASVAAPRARSRPRPSPLHRDTTQTPLTRCTVTSYGSAHTCYCISTNRDVNQHCVWPRTSSTVAMKNSRTCQDAHIAEMQGTNSPTPTVWSSTTQQGGHLRGVCCEGPSWASGNVMARSAPRSKASPSSGLSQPPSKNTDAAAAWARAPCGLQGANRHPSPISRLRQASTKYVEDMGEPQQRTESMDISLQGRKYGVELSLYTGSS